MKKSILEQKITYKALGFMLDDSGVLIDHALENPSPELKARFKNVCAMISEPLTTRLENTLGLLRMSKREFLEAAIIEALDKADLIMEECGVDDYLEGLAAHQEAEEQARIQHAIDSSNGAA